MDRYLNPLFCSCTFHAHPLYSIWMRVPFASFLFRSLIRVVKPYYHILQWSQFLPMICCILMQICLLLSCSDNPSFLNWATYFWSSLVLTISYGRNYLWMSEEYEKLNTSFIRQNSKTLHKLCMLTMREKISQVYDVIHHNLNNLEMILGRASNIRVDDVMQTQRNF